MSTKKSISVPFEAAESAEEKKIESALNIELSDGTVLSGKRVYVYLGPNVKGVVTCGSVFYGDKKQIMKTISDSAFAAECDKIIAKIERLVVADTDINRVKKLLKEPPNSFTEAYRAIEEVNE